MTDKELLEFAAKAIGYNAQFNMADACQLWTDDLNSGFIKFWNPLEDDGDALRLATALALDIEFRRLDEWHQVNPATYCGNKWDSSESCWYKPRVVHHNDPDAATRRAIVCAAAAKGKKLP